MADRDQREGRGHTALVTGATSGIGRALTLHLATRGYDVALVARRTALLEGLSGDIERTYGVRALPLTVDLSDPCSTETISDALGPSKINIDFLVNNAGYGMFGTYADLTWPEKEAFLRVMGAVPMELTSRLLPHMLAQGWGRILNIGSISALMTSSPNMVLYAATKSLLMRFSEGIAQECAGKGVNCTVSLPGFTDTELATASGTAEFIEGNRLAHMMMMSAEEVARDAYQAVMEGRRMTVPGVQNKILGSMLLHLPLPVRRRLSNAITAPIFRT